MVCGGGSQRLLSLNPTTVMVVLLLGLLLLLGCDNNGLCVDLGGRCDGKVDCEDKSDDCMMYEENLSYKKNIPPPLLENKTMVEVEMSVNVISLDGIDEIGSTVEFQYIMTLTWYESRRVFLNLRESKINQLSSDEIQALWLPKIVMLNTRSRQKIFVDDESIVSVKRMGDFAVEKNKRLFKGNQNPLSISRFFLSSVHFIWPGIHSMLKYVP